MTLFHLESLMGLLACTEFSRLQLFEMELLSFLDQLLPLVLQTFPLAFHRRFQFLKVTQLDFQLFHLCLDQQRHQTLDLSLLDGGQMFCLDGGRGQGSGSS